MVGVAARTTVPETALELIHFVFHCGIAIHGVFRVGNVVFPHIACILKSRQLRIFPVKPLESYFGVIAV